MTTIPDYLTVLAMSQQTHETHEMRAVRAMRSPGLPLRQRIAMRFTRPEAEAAATSPRLSLPEMRDYPYRAGC